MPRENKNGRGRREEKKLKRKRENGEEETPEVKRQKSQDPSDSESVQLLGTDIAPVPETVDEEGGTTERPFYGMLEDEEQEYFRRADELLELNDFPTDEERSLFLANVYREAQDKELKIACSQSCSRLMERLILLSTVEQKKKLFEKFSGNFAHLVQHRFASHCCETLFIQSAPIVTLELTEDLEDNAGVKEGEIFVSMENLFLYTLNELEGQMTFLLTDRFASHTLRVLLIILSGRPLEQSSTRTLLQSKKKEKIGINNIDTTPTELSLNKRSVPSSFQYAVEKIMNDTIATMDTSFIHILATHPTGNPTLQLLLELELTAPNTKKGVNSDHKTIISSLLPDDLSVDGSEAAVFINGILYDPIGSRLLETICTHAPGKLFKQIYKSVFKTRIAALARNEISSYVVIRVLNRLSKEDLEEAVADIVPHLEGLVQRQRTVIVKTVFERCHARGADLAELTEALSAAYGSDPSTLVLKMACIDDIESLTNTVLPPPAEEGAEPTAPKPLPKATPIQLHGSLLAQSLLSIPGPPSTLIQTSLLALPPTTLLTLALYTSTSHILQSSLAPISNNFSSATPQPSNLTFRRKLLNSLLTPQDSISHLALSNIGTHVLDSILLSAPTLLSLIERIALTLSALEVELRESFTGRIVWRNWSMDLFKRRRGEWVKKVQTTSPSTAINASHADSETNHSKSNVKGKGRGEGKGRERQKTAIELARERFMQGKSKKGTGVNKITV